MSDKPGISVIIATYNMPEWLAKVLCGYSVQTYPNFELLIADDGSGDATRDVIAGYRSRFKVPLTHLWHEDRGYRRQTILNRAIVTAAHPYILFSDGDCVPRADFVAVHAELAEPGRFLSGGYCKLPMATSQQIAVADIESQQCFDPSWLARIDKLGRSQRTKLSAKGAGARFLDLITPTKATFNNCNSSAWKTDLLAINGYDERMQYGGADREIGERLVNAGIRGKQIRHRAICLHLDHARGYKTQESLDRNLAIRRETRQRKRIETDHGIRQAEAAQAAEAAAAQPAVDRMQPEAAARAARE